MRILSHTCSTDADYNGGCAYALIEISPERAKKILARMDELEAVCRKDASAHELSFWDCEVLFLTAQFLSGDESLEEHLPEDGSYAVLPENIQVPEDCFERTEYEHLVVAFNGSQPGDSQSGGSQPEVYWLASPKHCSLYVETMPLPRSLIQQAATAEKGERRSP